MRSIRKAYDESDYKGDYDYIHDPDHSPDHEKLKEGGYYITEHGFARGSNRKDGGEHEPTRVVQHKNLIEIPSRELCEAVLRNSLDVKRFISIEIPDCYSASREVALQFGDHRINHSGINKLVVGFADGKMKDAGYRLSSHLAYRHHLSPDFRMEGRPIPKFDKKFSDEFE